MGSTEAMKTAESEQSDNSSQSIYRMETRGKKILYKEEADNDSGDDKEFSIEVFNSSSKLSTSKTHNEAVIDDLENESGDDSVDDKSSPKLSPPPASRTDETTVKNDSEDGTIYFDIPYKNCFQTIFKVKTVRKNRIRHTATSGWTSKLALVFWKAKKLSCVSAWKRANVSKDVIKCEGYCAMPGCTAKIACVATAHNLQFAITGRDPTFVHDPKKKRRILHVDKSAYIEMLDGKSAHGVYAQLLDDVMSDGDVEPSVVPGPNQLRLAKADAGNLRNVTPFASLSILQKAHPKAIHSIGYDPFFVIYSTHLQLAYFIGEILRGKTSISADATGLGMYICTVYS